MTALQSFMSTAHEAALTITSNHRKKKKKTSHSGNLISELLTIEVLPVNTRQYKQNARSVYFSVNFLWNNEF